MRRVAESLFEDAYVVWSRKNYDDDGICGPAEKRSGEQSNKCAWFLPMDWIEPSGEEALLLG